jgi:hypothetical protein
VNSAEPPNQRAERGYVTTGQSRWLNDNKPYLLDLDFTLDELHALTELENVVTAVQASLFVGQMVTELLAGVYQKLWLTGTNLGRFLVGSLSISNHPTKNSLSSGAISSRLCVWIAMVRQFTSSFGHRNRVCCGHAPAAFHIFTKIAKVH